METDDLHYHITSVEVGYQVQLYTLQGGKETWDGKLHYYRSWEETLKSLHHIPMD